MSSTRQSLIKWMQENCYLRSGYYYSTSSKVSRDGLDASGRYFSFGLCWSSVALVIGKYEDPALKRSAITEIDNRTLKNSFHCVFSHKVPPEAVAADSKLQDYFLLATDYQYAQLRCHHWLDPYYESKPYIDAHSTLERNEKLIPSQSDRGLTFLKDSLTATVGLLLDPFKNTSEENNNAALVYVFSQKDSKGNMPLFYEYHMTQAELDNTALYARIMQLDESDRAQLFLTRNEAGKTLLHEVFSHWFPIDFPTQIDRFGQNAVKIALRQGDEEGNTPIHYLFLRRNAADALSFVKFICELSKSRKPVEQKEPELEQKQESRSTDYLPVNLNGQNPLHILSKSAASDENPSIFVALLDIIPDKLKSKKIMEVDSAGFTPVHYAIKSRNFGLALEMIRKLKSAEKFHLILMRHNPKKKENLLHYICEFGSANLLREAIKILGPAELHRVRSEMPLKKYTNVFLCHTDFDEAIKEYSKLFDIFDYLVRTYNPGHKDFDARFEDFCACYAAIGAGGDLPRMSREFYSKDHIFWRGRHAYHQLRFCLSEVSNEERLEFESYLTFQVDDLIPGETTGATQPKQKASVASTVARKILNSNRQVPALLVSEAKEEGYLIIHTDEPPAYTSIATPPPSPPSNRLFAAVPPLDAAPSAGFSPKKPPAPKGGPRPRARTH